jgi:O-acetylhomoserine (thiol)-lyase
MQPFALGADLVYHSATKFLSGHGVVIGGLLVDSDSSTGMRRRAAKFPTLTEPYAGFHQMVFTEESTTAAFLLRRRREGVRDFGACMARSPRSRSCRGSRRCRCGWRATSRTRAARRVPRRAPMVGASAIRSLPSHPDHALAQRCCRKGCGAVFSFNLKGTRAQGRRFIETLAALLASRQRRRREVAVIHPASTTHFRMSAADLEAPASPRGRSAFGRTRAPDDLIEDLSRALHAAGKI